MAYSDDIAGAPDITSGGGEWDNLTATDNPGELTNLYGSPNNVWQKVFILAAGDYIFKHDNTPSGDTVMTIYSGPAGAGYADLTWIDADDDSNGNLKAKIYYTSPGGEWIYIESTGYLGGRVSGQTTLFGLPPAPVAGWTDCNARHGYLRGWASDMGVYTGPWPMMWPPSVNPDGFGNEVDFIVMLPNPAHPTDLQLVGDGTYDSSVYATYYYGGTWTDAGWWVDGAGVGEPDPPLPPVLLAGAHLYVQIFNDSGTPPTTAPAAFVPVSYGGTNPHEWSAGGWSDLQSASDQNQTGSYTASAFGGPRVVVSKSGIGYSNNPDWAAMSGLTTHSLPFPTFDLAGLEPDLNTMLAALIGTDGIGPGGMLHQWSSKHAYDPGDGEGIKALDPPAAAVQLGQDHQAREIGFSPDAMPPFFLGGPGPTWGYPPWNDERWLPSGPDTMSFRDMIGVALNTGSAFDYAGSLPPNPPGQTINIYGRQATHPLASDVAASYPGKIQDTSTMTLIGSFVVGFDFATSSITAPSTVDLSLTSIPMVADGSVYWSVEIVIEPAAWHSGVDVVNVTDPDAGALGNNSEVTYTAHWGFDCNLNNMDLPWVAHFPAFRYWVPGHLIDSSAPPPPPPVLVLTVDSPLRITQRDDGMGTQGHARMRIGPNGPSSTQWQRAPRVGDNNRYS